MAKRFYWLKLKEDFFSSKELRKLRSVAGGSIYTIIYIKLLLLAVKSDGVLSWTGLEDSFAEEIAWDLDEKSVDVAATLSYLLKTNLVETNDGLSFFFPSAVENTGSEGDSAERMRRAREKAKLLPVLSSQSDALLSHCDTEKEIREDKSKNTRKKIKDTDQIF